MLRDASLTNLISDLMSVLRPASRLEKSEESGHQYAKFSR